MDAPQGYTVHDATSVADLGFSKGVSEIIMEINIKKVVRKPRKI